MNTLSKNTITIIYDFMNKGYNYSRLKTFLINTLTIKKQLFEIYKCLALVDLPEYSYSHDMNRITYSIFNNFNLDDIYVVTKFNKTLINSKKNKF